MAFKKLPVTSFVKYISGHHSLNLDLEDGTGHDWHFRNYWYDGKFPIKLYGEGQPVDTNHLYGYYGVANREERLNSLGLTVQTVYIADHHRAILDLVYESMTKRYMIGYAKGCVNDFFYEEHHALELFKQLIIMLNAFDENRREILDEWLSREFRPFYRSWKAGRLQVREVAGY